MFAKHQYFLAPEDFHAAPLKIKFNQTVVREVNIPLGKDDTLRVFLDKESLEKFSISITITEHTEEEA